MKKPYVVTKSDIHFPLYIMPKGTRLRVDRVNIYKDGSLDCSRMHTSGIGRISYKIPIDIIEPVNPGKFKLFVVTKKLTGD